MLNASQIKAIVNNPKSQQANRLLDEVYSQAYHGLASKFKADAMQSTGFSRIAKIVHAHFLAKSGGANIPLQEDQRFTAVGYQSQRDGTVIQGAIPDLEVLKFVGSFQAPYKLGQEQGFPEVAEGLAQFANPEDKEAFKAYLKGSYGRFIKTIRELGGCNFPVARETLGALRLHLLDAIKPACPVVISREAAKVFRDICQIPALPGTLKEVSPNMMRPFNFQASVDDLRAVVNVIGNINQGMVDANGASKASPMSLKDTENGHELIFDEDPTKVIFIDRKEAGGYDVRVRENYMFPVTVATAGNQIGNIPPEDTVSLSPLGALVYHLIMYGLTSVGCRTADDNGIAKLGEDIYSALVSGMQSEDKWEQEYLRADQYLRDRLNRNYIREIMWFYGGTQFYFQDGLKWKDVMSNRSTRRNANRSAKVEDGVIETPEKIQVMETLFRKEQCIMRFKGSRIGISHDVTLIKGTNLTEQELKSMLRSLAWKKGKYNLEAKGIKEIAPTIRSVMKTKGISDIGEGIDRAVAFHKNKNKIVLILSDKGGNKGIDRMLLNAAVVVPLVNAEPVGFGYEQPKDAVNLGKCVPAFYNTQVKGYGDGTTPHFPMPDGSYTEAIGANDESGYKDFSLPEHIAQHFRKDAGNLKVFSPNINADETSYGLGESFYDQAGNVHRSAAITKKWHYQVHSDGSADGYYVRKGDTIGTFTLPNGTQFDFPANRNGVLTEMSWMVSYEGGSPRLRIYYCIVSFETELKIRGSLKATRIRASLEARKATLGNRSDDLLGELLVTAETNKSKDVAVFLQQEIGATVAKNKQLRNKLSAEACEVNEELCRLVADYNRKCGNPERDDHIYQSEEGLKNQYHLDLINYVDKVYGTAVWYTVAHADSDYVYWHLEATRARCKNGEMDKVDLADGTEAYADGDVEQERTYIIAFWKEGGVWKMKQRAYTFVGDASTGAFYTPVNMERSTVADAVNNATIVPNAMREMWRLDRKVAHQMAYAGAKQARAKYKLLLACYRGSLEIRERGGRDNYVGLEPNVPLAYKPDGKPYHVTSLHEQAVAQKVVAFLNQKVRDEDGSLSQEARQKLLRVLSKEPKINENIFALPCDRGVALVHIPAIASINSSDTFEPMEDLSGRVKEYLLYLIQGNDPNSRDMLDLANRIRSMLAKFVESDRFSCTLLMGASATQTRAVATPENPTFITRSLVSNDPGSEWQQMLLDCRQQLRELRELGYHEDADNLARFINRNGEVEAKFAVNRNPLHFWAIVKHQPVYQMEDGKCYVLEDGQYKRVHYPPNKYQDTLSQILAIMLRGDTDGDLMNKRWIDTSDLPYTDSGTVIASINETTGSDHSFSDVEVGDYWMDYLDFDEAPKTDALMGMAATTEEGFLVESQKTEEQWTKGVGTLYDFWVFTQSIIDIVNALPADKIRKVCQDAFIVREEGESNLEWAIATDEHPLTQHVVAEVYEKMLSNYEPPIYGMYQAMSAVLNDPESVEKKMALHSALAEGGVNEDYIGPIIGAAVTYAHARAMFDGHTYNTGKKVDIAVALANSYFSPAYAQVVLSAMFHCMTARRKLNLGELTFSAKHMRYAMLSPRQDEEVTRHMRVLDYFGVLNDENLKAKYDPIYDGTHLSDLLKESFTFGQVLDVVNDCNASLRGLTPTVDWQDLGWYGDDEGEPEEGNDQPDDDKGGGNVDKLNEDQRKAYDQVMRREHTVVRAPAGTGKTFLFHTLVEDLRAQGATVIEGATTGNASDVAGCKDGTIYSALGIKTGAGDFLPKGLGTNKASGRAPITSLAKKVPKGKDVFVLIDEVYAMSSEDLVLIGQLVQHANPDATLVLLGDPYQFTPSGKGAHKAYEDARYKLGKDEKGLGDESPYEVDENGRVVVPSLFRTMDFTFVNLAQNMRAVDEQFQYDLFLLKNGLTLGPTLWKRYQASKEAIPEDCLKLFYNNKDCYEEKDNLLMHRARAGVPHKQYRAQVKVNTSTVVVNGIEYEVDHAKSRGTKTILWHEGQKYESHAYELDAIERINTTAPSINLFEGEKAIITENLYQDHVTVLEGEPRGRLIAGNGSRVTVEALNRDSVTVRKELDGLQFELGKVRISHDLKNQIVYEQLPLAPGEAAITIFRSQGCTIDKPVLIHPWARGKKRLTYLSNQALFVACSRVTDPSQLYFDTSKDSWTLLMSAVMSADSNAIAHNQTHQKYYVRTHPYFGAVHLLHDPDKETQDRVGIGQDGAGNSYFHAEFRITTHPGPATAPACFDLAIAFNLDKVKVGEVDDSAIYMARSLTNGKQFGLDDYPELKEMVNELVVEWWQDNGWDDEGSESPGPSGKPDGSVNPGINIASKTPGLGGALTNYTTKSKEKGSINYDYPVIFRGVRYEDGEKAYQQNKHTVADHEKQALMTEIISAKLHQYPRLVQAIADQGGIAWLERCSHQVVGKAWEGQGRESTFIQALIAAYEGLSGRRFYAGVGSRKTPEEVLNHITIIGKRLAEQGYTLRSGGAKGADQAFQKGAGDAQIFRPEPEGYQDGGSKKQYDLNLWEKAKTIMEKHHGNVSALKAKEDYAYNLQVRNVFQVLGEDLSTPVDFVVCWRDPKAEFSGTDTAIKIAKEHTIPVYNLAVDDFPLDR